jgi:hypothetical protein
MHVEIIETVAQPRLPGSFRIVRDEPDTARIMLVEIVDDDARFRNGLVPRRIAKHWKLADSPEFLQRRAFGWIAEIDQIGRERNVVLVKRNQHLPAER